MKTKDLIKTLEQFGDRFGYKVAIELDNRNKTEFIILETVEEYKGDCLTIEAQVQYALDTIGTAFEEMNPSEREHLMKDIVIPYISTPIEERESEKKYIYRLPVKNNDESAVHLYKRTDYELRLDHSSIDHVIGVNIYHFTDKEVEKYTGKDKALFDACEKIEIEQE